MPYPVILGGDHAEFEQEWAASGRPDNERPDWPLPSFDAHDWAAAFCKLNPSMDEGIMQAWFANALMRGFDEAMARKRSVMAWDRWPTWIVALALVALVAYLMAK